MRRLPGRPRPVPGRCEVSADIGENGGNLLVGQPGDEFAQLLALGTHDGKAMAALCSKQDPHDQLVTAAYTHLL
jgi:hypothetical protein